MTSEQAPFIIKGANRLIVPEGPDLIAEAIKDRSNPFRLLSKQLGLRNRPEERTFENPPRITTQDRIQALLILLGQEELPLSVYQTFIANIRYGVRDRLDPVIFEKNIFTHSPNRKDLERWGLTIEDIEQAQQEPPILAGSLLFVHYDGVDENYFFFRVVEKGPYKGRYTVRGGHMENLFEITAFEEAQEEAGWNDFSRARPLGTADQIVAIEDNGKIKLEHYLNFMWQIPLNYNERPKTIDLQKPWVEVDDNKILKIDPQENLTPIAYCALKAAGFI